MFAPFSAISSSIVFFPISERVWVFAKKSLLIVFKGFK
jgi:hypothetical protein